MLLGGNSIFRMYPFDDPNGYHDLMYTGDYFTSIYDTILVTYNYRQRVFASLYAEDEYPANLAIYDTDLALRFVNKYIGDFCGDKDKVTVMTNSIGGAYFSFLLRNKESNKLLNRAILMSPAEIFTVKIIFYNL